MKIFISGVAGFLGSTLAEKFAACGHEVIGVDNFIGGYQDNIPNNIEFHQQDCKYLATMHRLMRGVDVVVHCACTAYEGLSVFSPALVTQNTFQITSTLLSAAAENGVQKFVYCSSMARYGEQNFPFTEDMAPIPVDPYGIAKVAAETLVKNICNIHGMDYIITVPHNIIGPRQKYDDPFRNVASIMINRMLQGKQPIIYGDGGQRRCFSFVDDCAWCFEKFVLEDTFNNDIFNIGPDEEFISINQLAEEIADILGFSLNPIYTRARPQEVRNATCSADKIRQKLGYETSVDLRTGLEQMVQYIEKRGTRPFRYHLDIEISSDTLPETWSKKLI